MNSILEARQCKPCDVIRAYVVIREIFSLRQIWKEIESIDFQIPYQVQVELFANINSFIYKCIHILLSQHFAPLPITEMVENMSPCIKEIEDFALKNPSITGIQSRRKTLEEKGIPQEIALNIAITIEKMQLFQIIVQNQNSNTFESQIAAYYSLYEDLTIPQLSKWIAKIPVESVLHKNAVRELELKLYANYCNLIQRFCENYSSDKTKWQDDKQKQIALFTKLVDDISKSEKQDFALVSMVVDKIDIL